MARYGKNRTRLECCSPFRIETTQMLHGAGIFTYMTGVISIANVGIHIPFMEPMGKGSGEKPLTSPSQAATKMFRT